MLILLVGVAIGISIVLQIEIRILRARLNSLLSRVEYLENPSPPVMVPFDYNSPDKYGVPVEMLRSNPPSVPVEMLRSNPPSVKSHIGAYWKILGGRK